jgi:hypothetical protein
LRFAHDDGFVVDDDIDLDEGFVVGGGYDCNAYKR